MHAISLLDSTHWHEFLNSQLCAGASKNAVDQIIPSLVQKMPKTRKPKTNKQSNTFRVDAQTSTDTLMLSNSIHESNAGTEEPKMKPPTKRNKKTDIAVLNAGTEEPIAESNAGTEEPKKKPPTKRNKKTDIAVLNAGTEEPIAESNTVTDEPIAGLNVEPNGVTEEPNMVDGTKKKTKRTKKTTEEVHTDKNQKTDSHINRERTFTEPSLETNQYNRTGMANEDVQIEVVIPVKEQLHLNFNNNNDELQEDAYNNDDELDLTEKFIDNVLHYVDNNGILYDSNFTLI